MPVKSGIVVLIAAIVIAGVIGVAFLSQGTATTPATTVKVQTQEPRSEVPPRTETPSTRTTANASASKVVEWMSVPLKDASTGQTFKIIDFKGKVVVLEIMAIWCPVCRQQGDEMQRALDGLPAGIKDRVVFISVDIDPNENELDLAKYADSLKRAWPFAYDSTGAFLKAFIQDRGTTVRSEIPAAPIYVIAPGGDVSRMPGGPYEVKSASLIISWLSRAQG